MAAHTTFPIGLTVAPARARASLPFRVLGTLLITTAIAIAIGVPLLLSGITGFNLWFGTGVSMEPTFHAGDFMITRSTQASELAPGDVILFETGRKHVMHRIVSTEAGPDGEAVLITRGDNNPVNDAPVVEGAVVGKLVYDLSWLPRSPVDLSGTGLFVAEWLISVVLVTLGIILRRNPSRPRRPVLRRSYGTRA